MRSACLLISATCSMRKLRPQPSRQPWTSRSLTPATPMRRAAGPSTGGEFGANLTHDDATTRALERFRLLARIDAGQILPIAVSIRLQAGEVCHFHASGVAHKEMRVVTKRVNYSGVTASIRIVKGIRWRLGSMSVDRVTQDVLTQIDSGDFYITNRRILIQGTRKNTAVPLSKVTDFTVYSDGLKIDKDSGKDVYVVGTTDWELAGACLNQALR